MGHQRSGIFIIVAFQTGCSVARLFRIINNGIQFNLNNGYIYINSISGRLRIKSLPSVLPLNNPQRYKGLSCRHGQDSHGWCVLFTPVFVSALEMSSHSHIICLLELFHFNYLFRQQVHFKAWLEDQS